MNNLNVPNQKQQPDVSVAMMTYFHEKYVAQAIESVLSQKTDYTYEIVVSDDGSTDGTRDILKKYAEKYPNIVKIHFNSVNQGISKNNFLTRSYCQGRYIATLSGDDYWLDETKLQKQVDFLDTHPECPAVVTCVEGRFEDSVRPFKVYPAKKYRGKYIDLPMYLNGATVGTHGLMMRNMYLTEEGRNYFSLVPKADVLKYQLAGGHTVVIRPSGTEPKLKLYFSVMAPTSQQALRLEQQLKAEVEEEIQ